MNKAKEQHIRHTEESQYLRQTARRRELRTIPMQRKAIKSVASSTKEKSQHHLRGVALTS